MIRHLKRFQHGGEIFRASIDSGIPLKEIIDFSASINPLGISRKAQKAIREASGFLPNYPDIYSSDFSVNIGLQLNIPIESIIPANGSTELIYLLPRALKPETVLIHEPTFSEYEKASRLAGARVINIVGIPFRKGPFIKALKGAGMAFLCNPNNPTGELLKRDYVLEIARYARKNRCYLVIDEAFIDFSPECSVMEEVRENSHLIVLRSMTKFHALAGLRAGYAVAAPITARKILAYKEPWTVNIPAALSSIASLQDKTHARKTMALIKKEKSYIERVLSSLGVWFSNSGANFYLIRMEKAQLFRNLLFGKGILVRDCSNFKGLGEDYLRFAVKTRRDNDILLSEIKGWLSESSC